VVTAALFIYFYMSPHPPQWGSIIASVLTWIMQGVILGLTISICSNYIYDQTKQALNDDNTRARKFSRMINFYLPEKHSESEVNRRTNITLQRVQSMKGEVCLLAVAGTSYLSERQPTKYSIPFIKKLIDREIAL